MSWYFGLDYPCEREIEFLGTISRIIKSLPFREAGYYDLLHLDVRSTINGILDELFIFDHMNIILP